MYRYISRESCSQFDSLPLTSLTFVYDRRPTPYVEIAYEEEERALAALRRTCAEARDAAEREQLRLAALLEEIALKTSAATRLEARAAAARAARAAASAVPAAATEATRRTADAEGAAQGAASRRRRPAEPGRTAASSSTDAMGATSAAAAPATGRRERDVRAWQRLRGATRVAFVSDSPPRSRGSATDIDPRRARFGDLIRKRGGGDGAPALPSK